MQILEHGQEHGRTLLFFPCTAEPVWAFADTIAQLSQSWHVFQVVYDGHQPEYPGDFTSVEQTVDAVISYLKSCGISQLDGAYGCSMGGACLTRMLASAALLDAKAAAGARCAVFQNGGKQPKGTGSGFSAETVYPSRA